jgi:hypothetical protein
MTFFFGGLGRESDDLVFSNGTSVPPLKRRPSLCSVNKMQTKCWLGVLVEEHLEKYFNVYLVFSTTLISRDKSLKNRSIPT